MKIRLEHGLAYVEVVLTFRGRSLCLGNTILDTDLRRYELRLSDPFKA